MARKLKSNDLKEWRTCPNMGQRIIEAAPFIIFKVPIGREHGDSRGWGVSHLLKACREDLGCELKMVIGLCNTNKWYDPEEFRRAGVTHVPIPIPGKKVISYQKNKNQDAQLQVPFSVQVQHFFSAVDEFYEENDDDKLLGVHSTAGGKR